MVWVLDNPHPLGYNTVILEYVRRRADDASSACNELNQV